MKSIFVRGLLTGVFLLLFASGAAAVECCCNLSGSCSGQICRNCDGCTGCSISCNGCDSTSSCGQCEINSVTGQFDNVALSDAVAQLVAGTSLEVTILGDSEKRVSLSFQDEPIRQVLARIESVAGVQLAISRTARLESSTAALVPCAAGQQRAGGWRIAGRPARPMRTPTLIEVGTR